MPRSLDEINADLLAKQAEIDELRADGSFSETLDNVDSDLQGVRDFIDQTSKDITAAGEKIGEDFDEMSEIVTDFGDVLGTEGVQESIAEAVDAGSEVVEGVRGGLDSTTNVTGQVQEGLDSLAEAIKLVQQIDDLRTAEGAEALEALAEVFETVVEELGPFIEFVPGLGAFFQLYAAGIRNIAFSAGIMEQIVGRNLELYQELRPGQYLYLTPDGMRATRLRALEYEYNQLFDEAMEAAGDELIARDAVDMDGPPSSVDMVVGSAIRSTAGPDINSEARQNWVASSNELDSANAGRTEALGAHLAAEDELATWEIRLETAGSHTDVAATQGRYDMAQDAVGRTATNLSNANATFDTALGNCTRDRAAFQAETDAYNEAVKTEIFRLNGFEHLTDGELATLAIMYPQWDIRGWQPAAVAAAATGVGAAAVGSTPTAGAVGGAVSAAGVSAGMSSGTRKLVMIGGGIFAVMMLFVVILVLSGDSTTPGELKTAAVATETEVTVAAQTDPPPTEADEEVDEATETDPPESDPPESDTGGFQQTPTAALMGVGEAHGLERPFVARRTDIVGDVGACGSPPGSGPGADVLGIVAGQDGDFVTVVVWMAQPPTTSATQFSFSVVLKVTFVSGDVKFFVYEVHNGNYRIGEFDGSGNVLPGSEGGTNIDDTAVTFGFPVDPSDPVALLSVEGFNLPTDGDSIGCDTAMVAARPFPSTASGTSGACSEDETTACLSDDRFGVQVTDPDGNLLTVQAAEKDGAVFGEGTTSGFVRLLNGCETNGHFWAFSDGFISEDGSAWETIVITDTDSGEVKVYTRSLDPFDTTVQDIAAFDTCS